jgi:hypothetical protein
VKLFYFRNRHCGPVKVPAENPDPQVLDNATGDAGVDGYTRLSRADRETGHRPSVGSVPE